MHMLNYQLFMILLRGIFPQVKTQILDGKIFIKTAQMEAVPSAAYANRAASRSPQQTRGRPWPREREGPAPSGVGGMSEAKVCVASLLTLPMIKSFAKMARMRYLCVQLVARCLATRKGNPVRARSCARNGYYSIGVRIPATDKVDNGGPGSGRPSDAKKCS